MSYANYELWKTMAVGHEPHLSIVIPTFNEEDRILPTIGAITGYVSKLGTDWELIVADDGSSDKTVEVVEALGFANLRVLKARHIGKGSAVQQGMLAARGKYVLFSDADNSTPIEEVTRLLPKLEYEGYDIAIGSRVPRSAKEIKSPLTRHLLRRWLSWLVHRTLPMSIHDTQCGFKLFTHAAAQHLYQAQTIMGFAFDVEILCLAAHLHYRVAEVLVGWVDAPESKFTYKEFQRFVRDLSKIARNSSKGRYASS